MTRSPAAIEPKTLALELGRLYTVTSFSATISHGVAGGVVLSTVTVSVEVTAGTVVVGVSAGAGAVGVGGTEGELQATSKKTSKANLARRE